MRNRITIGYSIGGEYMKNVMATIGSWLFILGIVLAIVAGLWPLTTLWVAILIIIGLLVGLLNVTAKEAKPFLLAAVSLVIVATFGGDVVGTVWAGLERMLNAMIVLTIPATIVVAIKEIFGMARD
ncbi:hypothetical protein C4573_07110 [Candidatus Woesearchaeota archaeon]|nr:MAG: hypothetical protein C4573_07110 [Candidatus Woesearchaeota archaeon]